VKPIIWFLAAGLSVALAQVRLPPYVHQALPNGVSLNIMPRHDVPLVTVRVVVRGGNESDMPGPAGVARVTADTLRRGTAKFSADEFSTALDSLGATFNAQVDEQSTTIVAEFLAKDLDAGLQLLTQAVMQPTFPETEVKKLLALHIDRAKAVKDNPAGATSEYYKSFFFGPNHPYGRPADELSLSGITRAQIVSYHDRIYKGRNMIVVVAGDVDAASAAPKIASAFEKVPAGEAYSWKTAPAPAKPGVRIAVVDKPDATQTRFMIGIPGINRTNPDRTTLLLVNTLFGGRFTSILNDELRVNSGLTYGANSVLDRNHLPGRITISTFTKTETTGKAVDVAIALLKRFQETGITQEQLESAKAYVKGTYPAQRLETSEQLAEILSDIELFGLNKGEVDDLFSRIDAVTLAQANAAIRKYYTSNSLTFLLLGNASKFAGELKKFGVEPTVVKIGDPGLSIR
jgi:zinc protease